MLIREKRETEVEGRNEFILHKIVHRFIFTDYVLQRLMTFNKDRSIAAL